MSARYHLRRADREITDPAQIDSIIVRGRYTTLALVDGDEPYAVTLSYGYDANSSRLYFHVAHEGHKIDVIGKNPRACATIVIDEGYNHGECEHPFESAVIRGTLRTVADDDEKLRAIRALVEHLEDEPEEYWASRSWNLSDRLAGFKALALEIESVTGKRGK